MGAKYILAVDRVSSAALSTELSSLDSFLKEHRQQVTQFSDLVEICAFISILKYQKATVEPRDQDVMGLKPTSYFLVSFYFLLRWRSVLIISTAVELTACDRERSWVQILPSAGLFPSFLSASSISYLTEVQHC